MCETHTLHEGPIDAPATPWALAWLGNAQVAHLTPKDHLLLTSCENEQAANFKFEHLRNFYILVHASLRKNIARALGCPARELELRRLPCPRCGDTHHGPPALFRNGEALEANGALLHVSLSKAQPYFAFALGNVPVGIDVECRSATQQVEAMKDVFCTRELELITQPGKEGGTRTQTEAAYTALKFWVRKEAVMKARGIGLVEPLNSIDTSGEIAETPDGPYWLASLSGSTNECELALAVPAGCKLGSCRLLEALC